MSADDLRRAWEGEGSDEERRVDEIVYEVSFHVELGPGSIPLLAMLGAIPRNQG